VFDTDKGSGLLDITLGLEFGVSGSIPGLATTSSLISRQWIQIKAHPLSTLMYEAPLSPKQATWLSDTIQVEH